MPGIGRQRIFISRDGGRVLPLPALITLLPPEQAWLPNRHRREWRLERESDPSCFYRAAQPEEHRAAHQGAC
ncbi:unnamed protein product [Pleuronectes platessa]|uniref:Uncharacterized protein n=1 Tax=Pleuronectes platessa TaxID=8262 RepID=A0A9N7TYB9_PLEPL|nr:unnamed protein product [Pleuronectes platessa]